MASASAACFSRISAAIGLGTAARVGECLLVGGTGRFQLFLKPVGRGEIVGDALAVPYGEDRADTRQRDPRHQRIQKQKRRHQPQQLRWKVLRLERRKRVVFRRRLGLGGQLWPSDVEVRTAAAAQSAAEKDAERFGDGKSENQIAD